MGESASPQDLYAKNLKQLFGYPLRAPEPSPGLPSSYAENGLHIGDIGYVDKNGMFEVLFNICFSSEHDLHRDKPDLASHVGLTDLHLDHVSSLLDAFPPGRVICHGVQASHDDNSKDDSSAPCKFVSCSASGAILILPSGAVCYDLKESQEKQFLKLAKERALSWCRFADRKSLYLITGFHKTSSWYLASFHGIGPSKRVLLERQGSKIYNWDSYCDHRQSSEQSTRENQTVFISGFKIEVRGWEPHPQAVVARLQADPRRIWSELALQASVLLGILLSIWRQMVLRTLSNLWNHVGLDADTSVDVNRVPAFSQPFHPSDFINRYLLDKNPGAMVAITHDRQWLSMLEMTEVSDKDMVEEGRFRVFLEANYVANPSSDDVVFLERKINKSNHGEANYLHESTPSSAAFTISATSHDIRQLVVTKMRAENVVTCLGRMPVGFYVVIQLGGIKRRSECKPAWFHDNIIEWDNEIMLPMDPMAEVNFSIVASFEFEPMLGNGEVICMLNTRIDKLANGGTTYFLFSSKGDEATLPPSLLVTLEERRLDPLAVSSHGGIVLEYEDSWCTEAATETEKGHEALVCYRRDGRKEKLSECAKCFNRALVLCPPGHKCRAAALFNFATAKLVSHLAHGTTPVLDVAICSYREVLKLRPMHHPDRLGTLLHLAQALSIRYRKLGYQAPDADEIEDIATEMKQICLERSHHRRAADLMFQTPKLHNVLQSGKLQVSELDERISEMELSMRTPSDPYFNWPYRSLDLSVSLRKCFEVTGSFGYLGRSISAMEEVLQLMPGGYFDEPWVLALLGSTHLMRFIQSGDVADLEKAIFNLNHAVKCSPEDHPFKPQILASLGDALQMCFLRWGHAIHLESAISKIKRAVEIAPESYFDQPWMLASLGNALRVRFTQRGCIASLTDAISYINRAVELASDGYEHKSWILASLGDALHARFVQNGDVADIHDSISMIKEAVGLSSDKHFKKPWLLTSLGDALHARFVQSGDLADIHDSISIMKEAVEISPHKHFKKPWLLVSLGNALRLRSVQCDDAADLESSISVLKEAVELTPDTHFDRPWTLTSLGNSFRARFIRSGSVTDLHASISIIEEAVELAPDRHFDRSWIIASLGNALRLRFVRCNDVPDLESSITMIEDAVGVTPDGHLNKPWMLACLSEALYQRFLLRRNGADLKESSSMAMDATKLAPGDHYLKLRMRTSLGSVLYEHFLRCYGEADLKNFISQLVYQPPMAMNLGSFAFQQIVQGETLTQAGVTAPANVHGCLCRWLTGTTICGQELVDFDDLIIHLGRIHGIQGPAERRLVCQWWSDGLLCGRDLRRDSFRRHTAVHLRRSFPCTDCHMIFARPDSMRRHLRNVHGKI